MRFLVMNELTKCLKANLKPCFGVRVALSGGIDSMALLSACLDLKAEGQLSYFDAIYIHHLEPYSDQAQAFCVDFCNTHGIDLQCIKIPHKAEHNKEATWRQARYAAICEHTPLSTQILLAHHLEDQAETFMLNALRGSGPLGLAGMQACQLKQKRFFIRPFLALEKDILLQTLNDKGIDYIQDPSNADMGLRRNFIRHTLMPTLEAKWHKPFKQLAQSAFLCQIVDDKSTFAAAIGRFRSWLKSFGIVLPRSRATAILKQLHHARSDKKVTIELGDWRLVRMGRIIYLDRVYEPKVHQLTFKPATYEYNHWLKVLARPIAKGQGIAKKYTHALTLAPRQGGETIELSPYQPKQKVKKLLQAWDIPARMKLDCPLVFYNKTVVAIPGFAIDHRFVSQDNGLSLKLISQETLAGCDSIPQICLDDFFEPAQLPE